MKKLNEKLGLLPEEIIKPEYDRNKLKTKIVHIGFGAFHRAHQAVYADQLAEQHNSDWGYCEINLIGGEKQISDLHAQDNLYCVAEMSPTGWNTRVVGVVKQALHAYMDGLNAVVAELCKEDVAIVSLTITEKGYCHNPATGHLNLQHPLIVHDLGNPDAPQSAVGVIVLALKQRKDKGMRGISVMSCDNMPENGHVMRHVVLEYAEQVDAELANWIKQHVSFPSTMVDRIVPAMTAESFGKIDQLLGFHDPVSIACEPFRQWVIEDNFVAGRPEWEKVGAQLVNNVLPYEEMKLRMLNGSHSFLAYLGYLAGYPHICDCMQDKSFASAARLLMLEEQAPTLSVTDVDLSAYADSLVQRYENPELKHRTWQIAMDGSQKLPQRMLDSIRWHIKHGDSYDFLALGVAGWMRYVKGVDEKGEPIEISDPIRDEITQVVAASAEGEARVQALLSIKSIFGVDLKANQSFVNKVTTAYLTLLEKGAKAAVNDLVTRYA